MSMLQARGDLCSGADRRDAAAQSRIEVPLTVTGQKVKIQEVK